VTGLYVAMVANQPVKACFGMIASLRKKAGKNTTKAAFTAAGLPVGLQAVAGLDRDALVLQLARSYEIAHPFVMPSIA